MTSSRAQCLFFFERMIKAWLAQWKTVAHRTLVNDVNYCRLRSYIIHTMLTEKNWLQTHRHTHGLPWLTSLQWCTGKDEVFYFMVVFLGWFRFNRNTDNSENWTFWKWSVSMVTSMDLTLCLFPVWSWCEQLTSSIIWLKHARARVPLIKRGHVWPSRR